MINPPVTGNTVEQWRTDVLNTVSKVCFFLSLPLFLLNLVLLAYDGRIEAVLISVLSIAALGAVTFWRSIGTTLRSLVLISLPFFVGTYWLVISGLPGTGRVYLLFAVALASLLFHRRIASAIWIVTLATVGLVYIAFAADLLPLPVAILDRLFNPATMAASWVAQGLVSIAIGVAIVMAVDRAHKSSAQAETTARELQRVNDQLEERVRDQTDELRRQADFLHRTQRAAQIGSYHLDFCADRWEASEIIDEIYGIDSTYERTRGGWLRLVHPLDRDRIRSGLAEPTLTPAGNYSTEFRIQRFDTGETR